MRNPHIRQHRFIAQLVALLLIFGMVRPLRGAPSDVFTSAAPMLGSDPPKAEALRDGDSSVSTQTGALQYSYPITVPPGRQGQAPSLALGYSSQGANYGGIAAGWTLSIPEIRRDTSGGILDQTELQQPELPRAKMRFTSSLAGSRPLIETDEPKASGVYKTFRAQNDTSYARYEWMQVGQPFEWRVLTPDGQTLYFGDASLVHDNWVTDLRSPLTRSVDAFGNTVEYEWTRTPGGDYRIDEIRYTSNPTANLPPFARLTFSWSPTASCPDLPVGAALSYRAGKAEESGVDRLTKVTVTAFDPATQGVLHTREINLAYDSKSEVCTDGFAPIRLLTRIQESAWHTGQPHVDLPAVEFTYGAMHRASWEPAWHGGWPQGQGQEQNALTWGRRFDSDRWPTVEAMLIDLDGDGLVDRLTSNKSGGCYADWARNTGTGFEVKQPIPLPMLPFDPLNPLSPGDACSLNYQLTNYMNNDPSVCPGVNQQDSRLVYRWMDVTGDGLVDLVTAIHHNWSAYEPSRGCFEPFGFECTEPFGPWPTCTDDFACPLMDAACIDAATYQCEHDFCFDGSVRLCLEEAHPVSCDVMFGMGGLGRETCTNQPVPGAPPDPWICQPQQQGCSRVLVPQELCGRYPWMIYENLGNGQFDGLTNVPSARPRFILSPIPLESDAGDSPSGPGGFSSGQHAVIDLDGDGFLDVVARYRDYDLDPGPFWYVWKGDGVDFHASDDGYPYLWLANDFTAPNASGLEYSDESPSYVEQTSMAVSGLTDLNGDGLPDLHFQRVFSNGQVDPVVHVQWNTGHRFGGLGSIGDTAVTSLSRTWIEANRIGSFQTDGSAVSKTRLLDYDGDGRVDVLHSTRDASGTWSPLRLMFNTGKNFATGFALSSDASVAVQQRSTANDPSGEFRWRRLHDFIDIDGDGVSEYVALPLGQDDLMMFRTPLTSTPPRLMSGIKNGQGLHVAVEYAPLADRSVVESAPDGRKASPSVQWVVKSLTTSDDFEASSSTMTYRYKYPVWSPDDEGKWGFRGFETVRATNPRGAVTEERYGYIADWSGRLESTVVFPAEGGGQQPSSIVDQTWQRYTLFGDAIEIFHPGHTWTYTCADGQLENVCRSDPATLKHEETVWTAITVNGVPQLHAATRQYLTDSVHFDAGDRYTDTSYVLHAPDLATYRLRATGTVSTWLHATTAQLETFARSETFWDPTYRVAVVERVHFSGATGDFADTARGYDLATGNVLSVTKPKQVATAGPSTQYLYDSRKLFVAKTTNEAGHVVDTVYDHGTGALLSTFGPNAYPCAPLCGGSLREETRTDVDGLGRPIATWISRNGTSSYVRVKVSETSYVDAPVGTTTPTSVTSKSLINYDGAAQWTQQKTELDGHGRPIKTTISGTPQSITTYDYDEAGQLVAVTVPDPSQGSGAYVTYDYGFDSIGRPTSMRRPGVQSSGDRSGIDLAYDGNQHTRTEVAGTSGGPTATTILHHDAFGRLESVEEATGGTPAFAITTYGYDARDAVNYIDDPDGVTTVLTHDWAGRRIAIERGTRLWQYGYDRNGNLTSEISPIPAGQLASSYTTTFAYDHLDRLSSKLIAPRNVDLADRVSLGIHQVTQEYDDPTSGANRVGRLFRARTLGPTGGLVLERTFTYDGEGNTTEDRSLYNLAGVSGTRRVKTTYWPGGKVREVDHGDGLSTDEVRTRARFDYDDRANPWKVFLGLDGASIGSWEWARYTRNAAGLVTERFKQQTGNGQPPQCSHWTYDKLGRTTQQRVHTNGCFGPIVAEQHLTFWGTDDPKTLNHSASGLTAQNFTFAYDARHQLTNVTTSPSTFSSSYVFTSGGRLAHARAALSSPPSSTSDVKPRDVAYVYGGSDPEMLAALRHGSADWALYTYDAAGNTSVRHHVALNELSTYLWDGDDQLRRATVGSSREEYFYDHAGTRVAVVKRTQSGSSWPVSQVKFFHGPTEIWLNGNGGVTHRFANVSLGTPVARVETSNDSGGCSNCGVVELQYHSTLQSLLVALSRSGAVKAAFTYGPYGETLQHAPTDAPKHRRRYNDKHKDETTGLYYYGYRYYDNVALQWTSADPLYRFTPEFDEDEPRFANLYSFNLNNPLTHVDLDGLRPGGSYRPVPRSFRSRNGARPGRHINTLRQNQQTRSRSSTVRDRVQSKPNPGGRRSHEVRPAAGGSARGSGGVVTVTVESSPNGGGGGSSPVVRGQCKRDDHGNSKASQKPQHRYEIRDQTGDVVKTGISGQNLNQNGSSPRANPQVSRLNRAEGAGTYNAQVVETSRPLKIPSREIDGISRSG